jgi:hypothetical protein
MPKFQRPPGWVKGRQLTDGERDEARHMLQALFEGTRLVRNAIEPQTGSYGLAVGQWRSQWLALKRDLDSFTERVSAGHGSPAARITAGQLDALERYYTPAEDQKCVVCGAPLAFSSSGEPGGGSRYNCSSDDASPVRSKKPTREYLDHYSSSGWTDRGQANGGVVLLIRAYRELKGA